MLETFKNAWKIEDLRKKIIYTALMLLIYRLGCAIAVPFIRPSALKAMINSTSGSMLTYLNMISGGAFANATLFALGVIPYINSSIIMTLLTVAIPALEKLSMEGEEGRKKINRITRYVAVGIGFLLAIGYYVVLKNQQALIYTTGFAGVFSAIVIILAFVGGTMLLMWMGEQIDKKGIGSGISLIIFTGIISRLSQSIALFVNMFKLGFAGEYKYFLYIVFFLLFVVLATALSVILNNAERRIPIVYAKKVVGRKMYGGQSTYLPIKVNISGVMPVIFSSALVSIPGTIKSFFTIKSEFWLKFFSIFDVNGSVYAVTYALLIILFNYFYVTIQYNPMEIANNLRTNSGTVPGIRPGKQTQEFIENILGKITFIGSLFLVVVALAPVIVGDITGINIQLGGTSLLIVVGVALEIAQKLESELVMRHRKGFLE